MTILSNHRLNTSQYFNQIIVPFFLQTYVEFARWREDQAVEVVAEHTAQENVLPVVRNDEQEFPHECCYCCLPASSYCGFSQDNAIEMRKTQK